MGGTVVVGQRYVDRDRRGGMPVPRVVEIKQIKKNRAEVENIQHAQLERVGKRSWVHLSRFRTKYFGLLERFDPTVNVTGATKVSGTITGGAVQKKVLKNHFILVCDGSASMRPHRAGAARLFNEQLDTLEKARDQENTVTVFHFGLDDGTEKQARIAEIRYNVPVAAVPRFTESTYPAVGNTPLYDAVLQAGRRALCDQDSEKSFVMVVLTDGQENRSKPGAKEAMEQFIREQQGTDRWTFVFLVPQGYKDSFVLASGVYPGNVKEWDNIDVARQDMAASTQTYLSQRRVGARSSKQWFSADLSSVGPRELHNLKDITFDVETLTVDFEREIMDFVNEKTKGCFAPGRSFFEVMKKEDRIQDYKKLILLHRPTGRIYTDGVQSVRELAGLPRTGDISLEPGNHGDFVVLVQSTSTNRLLPRGTKLVFWRNA